MPTTFLDAVLKQTRRIGDFPYPHWAAVFLNNPVRRSLGRPGVVAEALSLDGTERVLEIGPGPGYFSVELARRLPSGRLDLFDLQPQMLDKARKQLERNGFDVVGFHAGDAGGDLPFADASFDVAFLAAVIGEVPDKAACIHSLARVLRPGGLLAFVEYFPDPDRVSAAELRELVGPHGFAFASSQGTTWRDVVCFRRLPDSAVTE